LRVQESPPTCSRRTTNVWSVAFSPDGTQLISGSFDRSVRLWRAGDRALVRTLTNGTNHVYSVAFSPDGRWLASGGRGQGAFATVWKYFLGRSLTGRNGTTVRLWRVGEGRLQQALTEHTDDVTSVAFSRDGMWLATTGEDKAVKLWRLEVTQR
jgi:WD40 repeat protein